ncbi:MAG: multidrug effflux MFS transporter [Marinovum sp.]|nr:multidrug effflux MFS transporter [Marinovum sp.]MBT4871948.1 multidrug effflux MFS transporter [Marinovum sp.]MBT6097999.1 multidrug effflux MFS transporter [Marinovum sp.]MBT7906650.1 multidrug effflux MFS transporter [Marinovum sp.]
MSNWTEARFFNHSTQPHMATLILLSSISALAMNMFLPSLPSMAVHFESTPAIVGLAVGVYLGASALLQLVAGPLSDLYGRRPVALWALAIFALTSILITYAPNIHVFLALRAVQAVSACCVVISRAIVRDTTETSESGSKIGYVTMGMAIAPMLSPALGGLLDGWLGWQANFWFLAIVGGVIWLICYLDQGETAPPSALKISSQFAEYAELLKARRFWGYCISSALGAGAFFAFLGGGPFVGSVVFNLTPEALGIYIGVPAIGYIIGNFLSGRFSRQIGIDRMVLWGLLITMTGMSLSLLVSYGGYGTATSFFGFMTFVGLGNGITMPNATAGMLSVRPHLAGAASGLGSAIMIGGGAALSAVSGLILKPGSSEIPLVCLMWLSAAGGVLSILYVRRRNTGLRDK